MRRFLVFLALMTGALLSSAIAADAAALTAAANQHPVGGSGVQGRIMFTDDGSSLTIDGTATGLTAGVRYFSLIYTLKAGPGGPSETKTLPPTSDAIPACNDFSRAGPSASTTTPNQMVVGLWTNNNDGTGTIHVRKTSSGNSQDSQFASTLITIVNPATGTLVTLPLAVVLSFFGVSVPGTGSYAPIGTFQTVSIRSLADPANPFALVACGEVH